MSTPDLERAKRALMHIIKSAASPKRTHESLGENIEKYYQFRPGSLPGALASSQSNWLDTPGSSKLPYMDTKEGLSQKIPITRKTRYKLDGLQGAFDPRSDSYGITLYNKDPETKEHELSHQAEMGPALDRSDIPWHPSDRRAAMIPQETLDKYRSYAIPAERIASENARIQASLDNSEALGRRNIRLMEQFGTPSKYKPAISDSSHFLKRLLFSNKSHNKRMNYLATDAETAVRLAEIRRRYAYTHPGEDVTNPEIADKAIKWYINAHPDLYPKGIIDKDTQEDIRQLDRYLVDPWRMREMMPTTTRIGRPSEINSELPA